MSIFRNNKQKFACILCLIVSAVCIALFFSAQPSPQDRVLDLVKETSPLAYSFKNFGYEPSILQELLYSRPASPPRPFDAIRESIQEIDGHSKYLKDIVRTSPENHIRVTAFHFLRYIDEPAFRTVRARLEESDLQLVLDEAGFALALEDLDYLRGLQARNPSHNVVLPQLIDTVQSIHGR